MEVTMKTIRRALDPDEPDYKKAKKLGPRALPFLKRILRGRDQMLSSKAVYLASLIGGSDALNFVEASTKNRSLIVRLAATYGMKNFRGKDVEVPLLKLLGSNNPNISLAALNSASRFKRRKKIRDKIKDISLTNKKKYVRNEARKFLRIR